MPKNYGVIVEKNYGVILEKLPKKIYTFGAVTKAVENIFLEDGNWRLFLPTREKQHSIYFDSAGCCSFSALNVLEMIFNYQIKNKIISVGSMDWLNEKGYFDEQGMVNFSDRFIAKMSGTTKRGNTGLKVADTIRHSGLVPESLYGYPRTQRTPVFTWNNFYKEIPEDIKNLGLEFLKHFEINYERVYLNNFSEALTHSPVQVFIPTGCPKIDGIYQRCDNAIGHAVVRITKDLVDNYHPLFDTYELSKDSYIRKVVSDYKYYPTGFKYLISDKNLMTSDAKILKNKNSSQVGLFLPAHNESALQSYLKNIGRDVPLTNNKKLDWDKVVIDGEFQLNE